MFRKPHLIVCRKPHLQLYASLLGGLVLAVLGSGWLSAYARSVYSSLTVHEWGTFTSIAGSEGQALEWSPLTGSTELPSFVEHFRNAGFKLGLRGTVRMETPVLYFYSSREQTVSVQVRFAKGVITEWYPRATRVEPDALYDGSVTQARSDGSIGWDSVTLLPSIGSGFPKEAGENHYYAARQTTSTSLRVHTSVSDQHEKFLFYRGVSVFPVPIWAFVMPTSAGSGASGYEVRIENRNANEIPCTILFERRGNKLGYRVGGAVRKESMVDAPELTGTFDSLARELEGVLVAQGLFHNEAQAMVETWRDSWFEEGSRLLYIVPEKFVNAILPLTINPAPEQTVRVFVGRLELITPETQRAVEQAFARHDQATQQKYGRFLEPILQSMMKTEPDRAKVEKLRANLEGVYRTQIARNLQSN
jgi:hypothetical protein